MSGGNKGNNYKKYVTYYKILKKCINKSRQLQNKKHIHKNKNKGKAVWDIINNNINDIKANSEINMITYNDKVYTAPKDICEAFNNFYIELTNKEFKFEINDIAKTLTTHNLNTMFLIPTDKNEILQIINSLNNTNSVGIDDLSTKLIKACAKVICVPLTHIINLSFEEGLFPEALKISIVKPLFKKGNIADINNYRPVTLIPIISKIFEKIMLKRLHAFITANDILSPEQFGFRKNSNTTLACFNLIKYVTDSLNEKKPVVAVFLDMSKAFDFVDHKLLLYKLEKYGIRGKSFDWIKSYLTGRQQCVQISKIAEGKEVTTRSQLLYNAFGVPQGSLLGPELFLLYINDLPKATDKSTILFADDTTIIIKCEDANSFQNDIYDTIDKIITWLKNNNLKININKTKILQFRDYRTIPIDLHLNINDIKIESVNSTTFLGIIVDRFCNWKDHISHVCDKLDKFVYAIKMLRIKVSTEAALCAYHGYVSSVLSYGLLLWGNSVEIDKAFKVQKKCVRAICGVGLLESCKTLFKKFRILPLVCIYIRDICTFVKQNSHYFPKKSDINNRSAAPRHKYKLYLPQCRYDIYKKNVYINAITVYNKLPDHFKSLNLNKFKRQLTKWLLSNCFYTLNEYMTLKES